ncbi:mandelate racemase/muconate lactonizing enzyme family protein [Mucilaginibacter arboris]|uniref:Dipeptide epimerase n=1 Tax=Mucilaginibacter arboris TaxID=2682090 RepID=A0A7K1T0H7_9SPHI|nr:dipeptide epimerase [Mucilaginibacter arboris]MVN23065.1 dipeptide epimerase [Mucilaginibacter arboris]
MKFTSFEIYKYSIPIEPFTIATGTMEFAQNIFIRANTDIGLTGVGECSAFPMIVGESQGTCYELAKDFAAIWKNKDAAEIETRLAELDLYIAKNYTIKSAFDMVLYDLAAKHANQPLYKFLGGEKRKIETDITIGIAAPEAMAGSALKFKAQGFEIIKVKLGKQPEEDIERIKQIRNAIGPDIKLRLDANQGWTFDDAVFTLQNLAQYNIQFCEQPMRTYNDNLLPELCKLSPIPIMADESVYTHYDAERIIQNKSAKYINIKFAKSGGINEAIKINQVAEKNNINCMQGGMLESRLALTANVHFAMAFKNISFFDLDTCLLGHLVDPVIGGCKYNGMQLELDDSPGIGADVDQGYLDRLEQVII